MKIRQLGIVLFAAAFMAAGAAQAEVIFSPALSYEMDNIDVGAGKSEQTTYIIDARLGYKLPSGLYLGGMYSMTTADIDDESPSSYYFGPSIGYVNAGFSLIGTYFVLGEQDWAGDVKLIEGTGYQIDVSYALPVSSSFYLGPQLSYRSVSHDRAEQGGNEGDTDFDRTTIRPMINLWFVF